MEIAKVAQWASLLAALAQVGRLARDIWVAPSRRWAFVSQHWRDLLIMFLLASLFVCLGYPFVGSPPPNALLTAQAWDALSKNNFELALSKAEECITTFLGDANSQQAELQNQRVPPPLTGDVSVSDFGTITARGVLNDVATCYFIKGFVAEKKGDLKMAQEAYRETQKLSYGRCVDPTGRRRLWSPAEAATTTLDRLRQEVKE